VHGRVRDQVERDIYAPGLLGHGIGMLIDGLLVERIYLLPLDHSASSAYFLGHRVERRKGTTGKEDPRPLASEGTCHRTADCTASSVDHGVFVL
jgi:hypothetical protein